MPDPYDVPTLELMDADAVGVTRVNYEKHESICNFQKMELKEKEDKLLKIMNELEILRAIKRENGLSKLLADRKLLENENKADFKTLA